MQSHHIPTYIMEALDKSLDDSSIYKMTLRRILNKNNNNINNNDNNIHNIHYCSSSKKCMLCLMHDTHVMHDITSFSQQRIH